MGASLEGPSVGMPDWGGIDDLEVTLSGAFAPALATAGLGCASTKVVRRNWPKEEVVEETMPLGCCPDIVAISMLWAWARECEAPCHGVVG